MTDDRICGQCGGRMLPAVVEQEFHIDGKAMLLKGLSACQCERCGNVVYSPKETEMIGRIVGAFSDKPAVDTLDLEGTAEYLRASDPNVFRMIRAGRIKAYRVGRERRFLGSDIRAHLDGADRGSLLASSANGGKITERDRRILWNEIEKRLNSDYDGQRNP